MSNMKEFLRAMQYKTDSKKYEWGSEALGGFDNEQLEKNLNVLLSEINKLHDEDARSKLLKSLASHLNKFKMFDKSRQIIKTIPAEGIRGSAYSEVAVALASIGDRSEAVKLMKKAGSRAHWAGLIKQAIDLQDFADAEEIAKNIESLSEQRRQLTVIRALKNRYCKLIEEDDELFVIVSNELAKALRLRNGDKATIRVM